MTYINVIQDALTGPTTKPTSSPSLHFLGVSEEEKGRISPDQEGSLKRGIERSSTGYPSSRPKPLRMGNGEAVTDQQSRLTFKTMLGDLVIRQIDGQYVGEYRTGSNYEPSEDGYFRPKAWTTVETTAPFESQDAAKYAGLGLVAMILADTPYALSDWNEGFGATLHYSVCVAE